MVIRFRGTNMGTVLSRRFNCIYGENGPKIMNKKQLVLKHEMHSEREKTVVSLTVKGWSFS